MRDKLRRRYQVYREVSRNGYFEGEIAVTELKRLRELLHPDSPDSGERKVAVKFEFIENEFGVPMITGPLRTSLVLECQRCLQPLAIPIEQDFRLLIDASDETVQASSVETLSSDDGYIDINDLVEDELILALPLVALHEDTACNVHWQPAATAAEPAVKENPFAVLRQLKTSE